MIAIPENLEDQTRKQERNR